MKKTKNHKITAMLALIMALNISSPSFAEAIGVDAQIADHGDFTRFVLSFPKLTGYDITTDKRSLSITVDEDAAIKLPSGSGLIDKISQSVSNGTTVIRVDTNSTFKLKDYRYQRKIIFDIYKSSDVADATPQPTAKAQANTPIADKAKVIETKTTEVKAPIAADKKISAPVVAKTTTTEKSPAKSDKPLIKAEAKDEKNEAIVSATSLDDVKKKLQKYIQVSSADAKDNDSPPPVNVETPPSNNELKQVRPAISSPSNNGSMSDEDKKTAMEAETPTKITFSGLKPTSMAVFQRAGTLWIISDDASRKSMPIVEGPLKNFVPEPQIMRSKDAIAYAYDMPKDFFPIAKKRGLVWDILLYDRDYSICKNATINTSSDSKGSPTKVSIPLAGAGRVINFYDPIVGDNLYVAPTSNDESCISNQNMNPDFKINKANLGLVIKPYKDNLKVFSINDLVNISAESGLLNLFPHSFPVLVSTEDSEKVDINAINAQRIFNFPEWQKGGPEKFRENKIEIQDKIAASTTPEEQTGHLMDMATLMLSNGYGYEASGVLDLIQTITPDITKNPDYIAIRGAIEAIAGRYDKALEYFSYPLIQQNLEIKMWQGFAAAQTEQWKKAERSFPNNNILLLQYPSNIAIPFTVFMAESNLRLGKTQVAQHLLDTIKADDQEMSLHYRMAIDYLLGEIDHQKGNFKQAMKTWEKVSKGIDRLYHTKASLSLALLKLQQKEISVPDAINAVENLRFAWRGDSLEVEILHTLGSLKAKNAQPMDALDDLAQAIKNSKKINHDLAYLIEDMQKIFYDIFVSNAYPGISNLEAISVYNKYNYLFPAGDTAAEISMSFSDYLLKADLIDKAAQTLDKLIADSTTPVRMLPELGSKLATIYLIGEKPNKAIKALDDTEVEGIPKEMHEKRVLLKAKAFSQLNNTEEAAKILDQINSEQTSMIKADIFWKAKQWESAAKVIQTLIKDSAQAADEKNAQFILNAAIAWKLAGNQEEVHNLQSKYDTVMQGSKQYNAFKVITRDEKNPTLTNSEEIMKIADEVDIFKSFLDSYKQAAKQ